MDPIKDFSRFLNYKKIYKNKYNLFNMKYVNLKTFNGKLNTNSFGI